MSTLRFTPEFNHASDNWMWLFSGRGLRPVGCFCVSALQIAEGYQAGDNSEQHAHDLLEAKI